ncbi:MAG: NAD(P)/FAD-dependent oxidoreductase [Myxococcota bacterium]
MSRLVGERATADKAHARCALLGAGAAGLSCMLWLHDYGIDTMWHAPVEDLGGILRRVNNRIHNYVGGRYDHGAHLREAFRQQLSTTPDLDGPSGRTVTGIVFGEEDAPHTLKLDDGTECTADVVVLATGTRYRALGVPGEEELRGEFVAQSGNREGARFAGLSVGLVGGGDAGFENALILAERHHATVRMLLRNEEFRARDEFVERVRAHPKISFHPFPTSVRAIERFGARARLTLEVGPQTEHLVVDGLFVRIGTEPVLPELNQGLRADDEGYLHVDHHQRTSRPRVLAAGDVVAHPLRAVATAVGAGARAAYATAHLTGAFAGGKEELA